MMYSIVELAFENRHCFLSNKMNYFNRFVRNVIKSEDYSLMSLWLPKLMLKSICMWPDSNSNKKRKIFYYSSMMVCLFAESGLLLYLVQNYHDYNESLAVISSMSTIFQATLKMTALYQNSERIKFVLECMWSMFWPYDLAQDTKKAFKSGYLRRLCLMLFLLSSGCLFSLGNFISSMFSKERELPYKTVYPFDWKMSPIYQIIYLLQIGTHYLIDMSVCGFDFLFMGICAALINQYILLGKSFKQLGSGKMQHFYNKIHNLGCRKRQRGRINARHFLKLCVDQHQLLSRTTGVIEKIFNMVAFLQLCSSVLAICVSSFIATKNDVNTTQIATMGSYLIGHLIQLYVYCAAGNELLYQSNDLTNHIFGSNWYDIDCAVSKKDMVLIMKRAQIPAKLTAFKVFPLNFATFIAVVRLSFSSYTLLTNITKE